MLFLRNNLHVSSAVIIGASEKEIQTTPEASLLVCFYIKISFFVNKRIFRRVGVEFFIYNYLTNIWGAIHK